MKIVGPNELLEQPAGTVYCHYQTFGNMNNMCIKGNTMFHGKGQNGEFKGGDTWWLPLGEPIPKTSNDEDDSNGAWHRMEAGQSEELETQCFNHYGGGILSKDDLFVLLDDNDVKLLISALENRNHVEDDSW